jgi:hypothetical protein
VIEWKTAVANYITKRGHKEKDRHSTLTEMDACPMA